MDKVSSFSFSSNDVGLKESPLAVPDPGTLLRVLSRTCSVLLSYSYFSTFLFN